MSRPPNATANKPFAPISEHTVAEDMRIRFTRMLLKLREDTVKEVVFPTDLTNIERKFLHKLAEELGLKSKSHGKGDDRKITVTKPTEGGAGGSSPDINGGEIANFTLKPRTMDLLQKNVSSISIVNPIASNDTENRHGQFTKPSTINEDQSIIRTAYMKAQSEREKKPTYPTMQRKRESLPAFFHQTAVTSLIKQEQIVLVSGETGCGKTTQVPQFLLDDPEIGPVCRIVVTQPRRLSAISVSERIAAERGENIGGTIGYNIRLESEKSRTTQVLFVTPGVLLRKLQVDPTLEEFSHIIIDEAHERDRFTEFLMIILRRVTAKRASLKLVLMSATLQTNKLSAYFGNVPHIHIGGSVFPVQEFFLEHVLRFTDYVSQLPPVGNGGGRGQDNSALATYLRNCQEYTCAMCKTGPFKSPEELGTHCAMCTGIFQQLHQSQTMGKSNVSKKRYTSADELVRMLTLSFEASSQQSVSSTSQVPLSGAMGVPPMTSVTKALKRTLNVTKEGKELKEDVAEEEEEEVMITEEDDDEEGEDEEGNAVANAVSSVGVDQTTPIVEDTDGSEALVRQYLYSFDDTQVDYDLIVELLKYVFESEYCREGSVLVFMPGWDDISRMHRILTSHPQFGDSQIFKVLQLHSGIPKKAQSEVFAPLLPGEHKIILSTNIAETSVTIDDVAVVIDTGRLKEKSYDPHVKLAYLKSTWISQASARQRKGRAGRTRAGVCFHLFSKRRHISLPEFQDSEILRMPLEELVLQSKQLGLAPGKGDAPDGVQGFLLQALDPPHLLSITNAVSLLQAINCLDEHEAVTSLGRAVSRLPLDPRIGRIILLGCICGCGPAMIATSAAMGYRDPFVMPANEQQRAICNTVKANLAQGLPSDQIALLKAMEGFNTACERFHTGKAFQFCDEQFLSRSTMTYLRDLVQQLTNTLKEVGITANQAYYQRNNGNMAMLMSLVGIGLYPDVAIRLKGQQVFTTEKGRKAKLHPSSVNSKYPPYKGMCKENIDLVGYQDLVTVSNTNAPPGTAKLLMLNTTPISPLALLLTCGSLKEIPYTFTEDNDNEEVPGTGTVQDGNLSSPNPMIFVEVDNWIRLQVLPDTLRIIQSCRNTLTQAMEAFLNAPDAPLPAHLARGTDAIAQALSMEQPSAVANTSSYGSNGNNTMIQASYTESHSGRNSGGNSGRGYGRGGGGNSGGGRGGYNNSSGRAGGRY